MKNVLFSIIALACMASCSVQKPLYSWYEYNASSYLYLKNADEKSTQQMIEIYQKIIDKQKGSRQAVPPGIYADYGFLLLQADKAREGKAMLMQEIALYPESKVFIERVLKMMEE
jgi:hypothetical protein